MAPGSVPRAAPPRQQRAGTRLARGCWLLCAPCSGLRVPQLGLRVCRCGLRVPQHHPASSFHAASHPSALPRTAPRCPSRVRRRSLAHVDAATCVSRRGCARSPWHCTLVPCPTQEGPQVEQEGEKAPGRVSLEPQSRAGADGPCGRSPRAAGSSPRSLVRDLPDERSNLMPRAGNWSLSAGKGFATGHARGPRGTGVLSLPSPPRYPHGTWPCLALLWFKPCVLG